YGFMLPAIFVLLVFILGPVLYAVFLSFFDVKLLGGTSLSFTGTDNFTRLVGDSRALRAIVNTAVYVAIVVPVQTLLALVLAAVLNAGLRGQKAFRIIFFLPTLTSS